MRVFLCPSDLDLFPRLPYNVGMKDKELKIKVDDDFIEKVDYLQKINDFKNRSDTVRKVVEKEYRKECLAFPNCQDCKEYVECDERAMNRLFGKEKEE